MVFCFNRAASFNYIDDLEHGFYKLLGRATNIRIETKPSGEMRKIRKLSPKLNKKSFLPEDNESVDEHVEWTDESKFSAETLKCFDVTARPETKIVLDDKEGEKGQFVRQHDVVERCCVTCGINVVAIFVKYGFSPSLGCH